MGKGERTGRRWRYEPVSEDLIYGSSISSSIYSGRSEYQTIEVLDSAAFGRMLILDGKTQSAEIDEFIYHESLVHPALLTHPSPKSVLIAGGGEGATAREVLRHSSVERVLMVDLDPEVIKVSKEYLSSHHDRSFEDPRLEVQFDDAQSYLKNSKETFDVLILDLCDPTLDGPASGLYTLEFYQSVLSKMNNDGIVVTQMGPAGIINYLELFTAVSNTLNQVFPIVAPYVASIQSFGEPWGFGIASKNLNPYELTPEQINFRLQERNLTELRFYDGETHVGLFSLPLFLRQALAAESRVNSLDSPMVIF